MQDNTVEILLVEDDINDAELTIRALKKLNLVNKIFHAKDGEEAISFLFGSEPDQDQAPQQLPKLILLDIKMPKLSGIEVLEKIKTNEKTKFIPVIMLTSSNQHPDIRKCYALGANSYIVKPVGFENFVSSIKNLGYVWLFLNQAPGKQ